jgi:SAM-dependent methyltransferase
MPTWDDRASVADVPCPFCKEGLRHRVVETVWDAPESAVYQCDACGLVFLHPTMSPDEEKAFYEAEFSRYMKLRGGPGETVPEEHFARNRGEAERRLLNLKPYLRSDMRVLELGSSTGFLLSVLRSRVSSVTGIEPNRLYAAHARSLKLETCLDLSDVEGRKYDLVLAYYVLEHLRDPVTYLERIRAALNSGGLLALEVPNVDDALVSLYRVKSFDRFYWQKAHYFYYSYRTLRMVLEQAGFGPVQMIPEHRYDFSNHIHWLSRGEPGGLGKYSHIFDAEFDRKYAERLKRHWLCDTVFAVAEAAGSTLE